MGIKFPEKNVTVEWPLSEQKLDQYYMHMMFWCILLSITLLLVLAKLIFSINITCDSYVINILSV